jgi:hypothetical protein
MNTPLIVACALVALGLVVAVLDALPWGVETYTISTRDLPNTATDPRSDTSADTSAGVRS